MGEMQADKNDEARVPVAARYSSMAEESGKGPVVSDETRSRRSSSSRSTSRRSPKVERANGPTTREAESLENEAKRLIDDALPVVATGLDALSKGMDQAQAGTFRAIGALYLILTRCRRDPALLEALMTAYKVRPWGQREVSHLVVHAARNASRRTREWPRSTLSDWAKMLRACEVAKVEEDVSSVVRWFDEEQDVRADGKPLRGYRKAYAILAADPDEHKANKQRREDRRRNANAMGHAEVSKGSESPLGSIVANNEHDVPDSIWVAILEGSTVRRALTSDPRLVQKIALLCRTASAEPAGDHR